MALRFTLLVMMKQMYISRIYCETGNRRMAVFSGGMGIGKEGKEKMAR
jgi:hypothetical protein